MSRAWSPTACSLKGRSPDCFASAIASVTYKDSQTYNGTKLREWKLAGGLYVQQYVKRKSFTIIDLDRRSIAFVDDGESDPEWWMEPSRLVREVITRRIEEELRFVFHAAAVSLGEFGVALIGPKRAGKTTLTIAALEYTKAAFIANDRTYFELKDGTAYMHGWACTAALGIGTCLASPALRTVLENRVTSRYPQPTLDSRLDLEEFRRKGVTAKIQEKVKIELTPFEIGETFGVPVVPCQKLSVLILPKLDPSCEMPELRCVTPSESTELLREQALTCDNVDYPDWLHLRRATDVETERHVSAFIDEFVRVVPSYEVRYWDTVDGAHALRDVLLASNGGFEND